jgi:hypothetical protein
LIPFSGKRYCKGYARKESPRAELQILQAKLASGIGFKETGALPQISETDEAQVSNDKMKDDGLVVKFYMAVGR